MLYLCAMSSIERVGMVVYGWVSYPQVLVDRVGSSLGTRAQAHTRAPSCPKTRPQPRERRRMWIPLRHQRATQGAPPTHPEHKRQENRTSPPKQRPHCGAPGGTRQGLGVPGVPDRKTHRPRAPRLTTPTQSGRLYARCPSQPRPTRPDSRRLHGPDAAKTPPRCPNFPQPGPHSQDSTGRTPR